MGSRQSRTPAQKAQRRAELEAEWVAKQPLHSHRHFYSQKRGGNAGIGVLLLAFVGGTYAYTMLALGQDDFSDIDDEGNSVKE